MNNNFSKKIKETQLYKKMLNNKFSIFLIVSLLLFLNILVLTQISFIFTPIIITLEIVGPPLILSLIFFYLLKPTIDWLEEKGLSRNLSMIIILIILVILLIISIYFLIPAVRSQVESMIASFPVYWNQLLEMTENFVNTDAFSELVDQIQEGDIINSLTNRGTNLFSATIGGIGSVIGLAAQIIITIFTAPILLYYFLTDGEKFPEYILKFTPTNWRPTISKFLRNAHFQLGYYVRGQLIVAFVVGVMFWIGFSIIGLNYGLLLAIIAGILNLVPYLGSIMAAIPALIIGIVDSPLMFLYVIIVISVEQFLEGRLVQPFVLGNQLRIHPITIIFLLLIAGRLFGLTGIILGIPAYAIIKIIVSMAFSYLHEHSDLYHDKEISPTNTETALINRQDDIDK